MNYIFPLSNGSDKQQKNEIYVTDIVLRQIILFSDRWVWANSVDPDQTAPTLFAIPAASFGLITL